MMSNFTLRDPRILALAIMVILSVGISALTTLGRQEDPTITNIYASVYTALPGADAARVEALVSTEVENTLQRISEIDSLTSVSYSGGSTIYIALRDTIHKDEIEQVWTEIRSALEDARFRLPKEATEPRLNNEGITAYSTVIGVQMTHPNTTSTVAGAYAEVIADRIRTIPNTRLVHLFGDPTEEVLVSVDPYESGALGISIEEIAQSIADANGQVDAGQVITESTNASLSLSGELDQLDAVRKIPIRENPDGRSITVENLAQVTRGPRLPNDSYALANGKPAILLAAIAEDGVQIDRWMGFVREELAEAALEAPYGLNVELLFDQSTYTVDRLAEVGKSMMVGMLIVIAVLMFTLGWRAAAVVALILPLVSLATLGTMALIDMPLHQMSVSGLIASLGLVVDAAIVTTDTVRRKLAEGMTRAEAISKTVSRLVMPLAASTFTTVLSFLPMLLLPGPVGDFVSAIAISVMIMLTWSFVLAIFLTAPLSGTFLSAAEPERAPKQNFVHGLMVAIIRFPVAAISVSLILPILGFALLGTLTPQFFPTVERNQFHLDVELPGHTGIARTKALTEDIDAVLRGIDGVASSYWGIGTSAPSFYYNIVGGGSGDSGYAQGMVTTDNPAATNRILDMLQPLLTNRFPEAQIIVRRLAQGPGIAAPVSFSLKGEDQAVLRRLGEEVQTILAQLPEVTQVRAGLSAGPPQVHYNIREAEAQMVGLDVNAVARQLETGLSGIIGGSIVERSEQIPIRIRFDNKVRSEIARINDMPMILSNNNTPGVIPSTPLSTFADPELQSADPVIVRIDGERLNEISAYLQPNVLPEQALRRALTAIENSDFILPPGYRMDLGGDSDERSDTVRNLLSGAGMIITLTLATLVLTFRSYRLTLGTLIVAVLATGLSLLSLAVMQFPFGINAVLGVVGSIGVSVNAAIIIFTALKDNPEAAAGDVNAGATEVLGASRHIISTTVTTFGGFLPLILTDGLFWPPFAVSVAGGVILSSTIAFIFTPAFFFLAYRRRFSRDFPKAEDFVAVDYETKKVKMLFGHLRQIEKAS